MATATAYGSLRVGPISGVMLVSDKSAARVAIDELGGDGNPVDLSSDSVTPADH